MDASDPPAPSPADTHDSSEHPDDILDQPETAKKTGGAVKKRKRSLSYKTKKGSNNQKSSRTPHQSAVDDNSSAATIPQAAPPIPEDTTTMELHSTEFKKSSKADILRMLNRCQQELAEAYSLNTAKDKSIKSLTKKNNQLIESSKLARTAAREARNEAKQMENSAHASEKKLQKQLLDAQDEAFVSSIRLKEKEEEWDKRMRESVDKARDEEKVSLQSLSNNVK
jgi:hypothetical protein